MEADTANGLSAQLAAAALARDGYNELASAKPRRIWAIAWSVLTEPMLLLLLVCGVIYLLLGDRQQALILLCSAFAILAITFFQERKTERALEALRDLSSPRALVLRDGVQQRIAGREVVRGDLILLSEGDRVPADSVLLTCMNLSIDESLLSGEALAVSKAVLQPQPVAMGQAGGENSPFVFSGTLVVQGKGMALVLATGMQTAIGQIGKVLATLEAEPTRIQRETTRMVKYVASASIACALFLALWFGLTRGDWAQALLVGITFAMALIPEELPVVLTIFFGIGAWRIAKQRVLTRRIPAIETLGAASVLCVDKTGTLTQNKMTVVSLFADGLFCPFHDADLDLPEEFHSVMEYAILASHRDPFDPMEVAILQAGRKRLQDTEHLHDSWKLLEEYPLSQELLAMSRVWQSGSSNDYLIAAKGAPEAIFDLCHLAPARIATLSAQVNAMAGQGWRVLGVSRAIFQVQTSDTKLPEIQHDFEFEFLGLIALADPLRAGVAEAIAECQSAGIRVIMITGDYPATAQNIARQCGLVSKGGVLSGADLTALSDQQLQERIQDVNIFCRVVPEQKYRLVKLLKDSGEIVAMTGDGVNDAPALKAAHIGIAMGQRGTDVAREAAALVLLDDDFASIVAAIKLGRRIFDNLRKTVSFIVAVHIPVIGMSVLPVLLGWPVVLMPVHILFLELIIDPTCSVVFEAEPEEAELMQRRPRATEASIFERAILQSGAVQGTALFVTTLAIFWLARHKGIDTDSARALAFTCMVIGNIALIFVNRSSTRTLLGVLCLPNPALWWVSISALLVLWAALFIPALSKLFYFGKVDPIQLVGAALAALLCMLSVAGIKSYRLNQ